MPKDEAEDLPYSWTLVRQGSLSAQASREKKHLDYTWQVHWRFERRETTTIGRQVDTQKIAEQTVKAAAELLPFQTAYSPNVEISVLLDLSGNLLSDKEFASVIRAILLSLSDKSNSRQGIDSTDNEAGQDKCICHLKLAKIAAAENQLTNKSAALLSEIIQRPDHDLHLLDLAENQLDHLGVKQLLKDCSHDWGAKVYRACVPRKKRGKLYPLTIILSANFIRRPDDLIRDVVAHWSKMADSMRADPHLLRWTPEWFVCSGYGHECTEFDCAAASRRQCPPFHIVGLRQQRQEPDDDDECRHWRERGRSASSCSASRAGSSSSSGKGSSSFISTSSSDVSGEEVDDDEKSSLADDDDDSSSSSGSVTRDGRLRSGGTASCKSESKYPVKIYLAASALVYFYPDRLDESGSVVGHWDGLRFVVDLLTGSRASEWVSIDRTKEAVSEAVKELERRGRLSGFGGWIDKLNLDKKNLGIPSVAAAQCIEVYVGLHRSRVRQRNNPVVVLPPSDLLRFLLKTSKPGMAAIAPLSDLIVRLRKRHLLRL